MKSWSVVVCVGSLALALACGGSGGSGGSEQDLEGTLALNCTDKVWIDWRDYAVENNTYGNDGAAHPYTGFTQCIDITSAGEERGAKAGWSWDWSGVPEAYRLEGERAFPEIIYGQKPWSQPTNTVLPARLGDLTSVKVEFDYTGELSADYSGLLSLGEFFTTSDEKAGDHLPIAATMNVYLGMYHSSALPTATRVMIGGYTWLAATGVGDQPWASYVLDASEAPSHVSLDLMDFVADFQDRTGSIVDDDFLASVSLGNYIRAGTGSTTVDNFKVTVE